MSDAADEVQSGVSSPQAAASLADAVTTHDRLIAESGITLWLGAEPTFTNPSSRAVEWRTTALGSEKEDKAREFVRILAAAMPGTVVLRTLGRQYPGESRPRWNYGIYSRRDGKSVWKGPPDPIIEPDRDITSRVFDTRATQLSATPGPAVVESSPTTDSICQSNPGIVSKCLELRAALALALQTAGLHIHLDLPNVGWGMRLLFADNAALLTADWHNDPQAIRPPLQSKPIPLDGCQDELAARGIRLLAFGPCETDFECDRTCIQVELPAFENVNSWLLFLELIEKAAMSVGVQSLVFTGFPPPIDCRVAWTTVTPDPGVLEINMAPSASASEFLVQQKKLHAAAAAVGLSPFQMLFNGEVVDSGGGQHLTFGGPSPEESPFLFRPHLLPRLVACLNRHPALSYWFAVRAVGSCGQQPRPDEVSPESLDGLSLALDRLFQRTAISPELLWRSLAPFLCDRFGNTHRCEINVEKLWNTLNSERGCLGLVELRAFRMTRSADESAAVATFLRTLITWLALSHSKSGITEWGSRLHDRFSLPFYLLRDLRDLLTEIANAGFPLDEAITSFLLDDSFIMIGDRKLNGTHLTVRQAIEFWPVVGDLSAQNSSFRLMDSSTQRIEISLREPKDNKAADDNVQNSSWRLLVMGREIPWVVEHDADQTVYLRGVRYKAFHPQMAISPLSDVIDPVEFFLISAADRQTWRVRLFGWHPNGLAYDGCPKDFEESKHRRNERLVVEKVAAASPATAVPSSALSEYCVDLRRIDRVAN